MNITHLYHYTKAETAIRKILPDKVLLMNFLANMNDPKENLTHVINVNESINQWKNGVSNYQEFLLAHKIRDGVRLSSFSTDREFLVEGRMQKLKGYEFQKMWSMYGQNFEGVCFEIDKNIFIEENESLIKSHKIIKNKVEYKTYQFIDIPTPLQGVDLSKNKNHRTPTLSEFWENLKEDERFINERLFTKNIDWEGESEYRFITLSNDSDSIYLSMQKSLTKVILGLNFSKHLLPSIEALVPKDKIYQIILDKFDGKFRIEKVF